MKSFNSQHVLDTIKKHVHYTPVLSSYLLNETYGAKLLFKCENFQKAGSFKIRGAIYSASEKLKKYGKQPLAGHSSGNFAQALALSGALLGTETIIAMPENAPRVKVEGVERYGGKILFSGNRPKDREALIKDYLKEHPETLFLHPSDDIDMIHGNASSALELLSDHPETDILCVPVGGGGLLAGTALAADASVSAPKVYGAEPEGADDARRSFHSGRLVPSIHPDTIADGLRTDLGENNFPIIRALVSDILTVSDNQIIDAMKEIYQYLKIVIEPSSAVPLAVVKKYPEIFGDKTVGIIITGGNIDLSTLREIF